MSNPEIRTVAKSRFDECCPHCGTWLAVYDQFISHNYETNFDMECTHCGKHITVIVHTVPEFELRT
jgi:hypothetical protein